MEPFNLEDSGYKIMMQELKLIENGVGAVSDTLMTKSELIIPTPFGVAYKKNNTIILKDGLDLTMKPYVWGIQARPNLLISRLMAEDMPDAKEEWKRNLCTDIEFLPNYASRLDYHGREIVPAEDRDIYCWKSWGYDKTAEILQEYGVDCMPWKDKRFAFWATDEVKVFNATYWATGKEFDATYNFICKGYNGVHTFRVEACRAWHRSKGLKDWAPGRMALWIK